MAKTKKLRSTGHSLRRLAFRQSLRSAVIIGLLTGLMMGAQGAAYAAAFPDQKSRDAMVASLEKAPALGFMAGEIQNAASPASYGIYKSITLVTLVTGIWGIFVVTRLLRGQEEDGRLEMILTGRTTKAAATIHLLIGFSYSLAISMVLTWAFIALLGMDPNVKLEAGHAALLTLGVFLPGIFFGSLATLTSQLTLTRGRAMAYALVPLMVFFVIRGAANSLSDWNDLKRFTPFGWTDLLNPVLGPQIGWIYPAFIFALLVIPLSLYLAKNRDLGQSILPQSTRARSHPYLLGSDIQLIIRQNIGSFLTWCIGTLAFTGLLVGLAKIASDLILESAGMAEIIGRIGGVRADMVVAFISLGGMFTALILLVMTAVCMGSIRTQEAKGYADNLLVQPISRSGWLAKRLFVIIAMAGIICLLNGFLVWLITDAQDISFNLGYLLQNATALTGTLILLLGIGTFFYGVLPRLATISMFVVIIWTFVVDVFKAFFSLDDAIDKSSLLHYVSFTPTQAPDWHQFWWLVFIGVGLMVIGIWRFSRRDIVSE